MSLSWSRNSWIFEGSVIWTFASISATERNYETDYDVIIIGAGAAGYSAGVYIKRSGMSVAILERESVPFHPHCLSMI